jgi:DNA-binding response OmpR family regulator
MSRLLIVEDQPVLLDAVRRGLAAEGFDVICAATGAEGIELCASAKPDAIILDLMLPDGDGLLLLEQMRQGGFQKPVLIVSARDSVDQRITGLNMGADDYLVKPFVFSELLARVRALLRRPAKSAESTLYFDDIVLDLLTRKVTQGGLLIDLTARQFDVLAYLLQHKNEVVSREMLARDIWHAETATWTNLIEVQVNRLRKQLETKGRKLRLHTIRGEGYLLGDRRS